MIYDVQRVNFETFFISYAFRLYKIKRTDQKKTLIVCLHIMLFSLKSKVFKKEKKRGNRVYSLFHDYEIRLKIIIPVDGRI